MTTDGWRIGDRVEVGSLWALRWLVRPRPRRPGVPGHKATGHITAIRDIGITVEFDCGLVNGVSFCTASPDELTRIEEFDAVSVLNEGKT